MIYDVLLLGALLVSSFSLVLLFTTWGREYLNAYAMLMGGLVVAFTPVSINAFGHPFLPIEVFYASVFLSTDIVAELYDRHKARQVVWHAAIGMLIVLLLIKLASGITLSEFDLSSGYLDTVSSVYTVFAGLIVVCAFVLEQSVDITNYERIKVWTQGKYLWVRNCFSTITTQLIDVLLVYSLFFYPVLGFMVWKLMLAAFIFKGCMALIDTPFIYLAKHVTRKTTETTGTPTAAVQIGP